MAQSSHPSADDRATVRIDAPASDVWALITDIAGMGRFSPECTGGRWLDGASGPAVGARFKGTNRRGIARWSTTNEVVEAVPDRSFAFETKQSGTRWRYELEPAEDGGTLLTESREAWRPRPLLARVFTAVALGGGRSHEDELREGMTATLERIKQEAESRGGAA